MRRTVRRATPKPCARCAETMPRSVRRRGLEDNASSTTPKRLRHDPVASAAKHRKAGRESPSHRGGKGVRQGNPLHCQGDEWRRRRSDPTANPRPFPSALAQNQQATRKKPPTSPGPVPIVSLADSLRRSEPPEPFRGQGGAFSCVLRNPAKVTRTAGLYQHQINHPDYCLLFVHFTDFDGIALHLMFTGMRRIFCTVCFLSAFRAS